MWDGLGASDGRRSTEPGGEEDVYVAKLDRTGRRLIYATYLGGPGLDEGDAGVVDREGHLYVSGFAGPGFPTTQGAFDQTFNGDGNCCGGFASDAFIAKLSSDGSRLVYSTYLGGSSGERANILALGRDGSVSATGFTGSADFPTTPGALRATFGGGSGTFEGIPLDSYAVRLDPTGSRLVYSTYLGGSADDNGNDVAVDDAGNAYYVGTTQSADFPTTPGSLQPTLQPGSPAQDAYVTKLDKHGNLVWSTYVGGPQRDRGSAVDIGKHGDVYVSGTTRGDFPVSAHAAQTAFGGGRDWFLAKLDRSGAALDWSTYLGGSDLDGEIDNGMRVDRHGNADVVGMTASSDFPTTPDAFQAHNAGGSDIAIAQFDRNGRLRFSSYLGGSGNDDTGGSAPAVDRRGDVFVAGATDSVDFPVSAGAVQPAYGGGPIDGILLEVSLGRDDGNDGDDD